MSADREDPGSAAGAADAGKPGSRASTSGDATARASTARASTARESTARESTARESTARESTARESTARESTVFVVDDDDAVRDGLRMLLESAGLQAQSFRSPEEFIAGYRPDRAGCLVLDIRMPGMSGLELQQRLPALGIALPVIILTGHGDVPAAVQALKSGAVDFIEKPFDAELLLERIRGALARDAESRRREAGRARCGERLARLTPREREVMKLMVAGKANKVIATELGISERTVELHRSRVMRKMQARSLPELVRTLLEHRAGGAAAPPATAD